MNEFQVSIIAAASALLGALIPTIFNYINNVRQNNFELKKSLLEKQKEVYWELMEALQEIINTTNDEEFKKLQKSVLKISIYGDNSSSVSLNRYFQELIRFSRGQRIPLSQEEHRLFQKEILNGMRQHLGLKPFESFEIIGFHPDKK